MPTQFFAIFICALRMKLKNNKKLVGITRQTRQKLIVIFFTNKFKLTPPPPRYKMPVMPILLFIGLL